ncbi:hypothetical protein EYC59_01330 [Candidatus Saccharibacteria bacterium]|nr:MAG: hypothetical protein EYC59_01330 [Candidatus Saccharibacteria bacterium]
MTSVPEQFASGVVCSFQLEGRKFVADHTTPASVFETAQRVSTAGAQVLRSGFDQEARRAVQDRKRRLEDAAARAALGHPLEAPQETVVVDERGQKVQAVCDACALCEGGTKPVAFVNQQGICPEQKAENATARNGGNYYDERWAANQAAL